jgi:hypothetical protein
MPKVEVKGRSGLSHRVKSWVLQDHPAMPMSGFVETGSRDPWLARSILTASCCHGWMRSALHPPPTWNNQWLSGLATEQNGREIPSLSDGQVLANIWRAFLAFPYLRLCYMVAMDGAQ